MSTIGFIGTGQLATALAQGFVQSNALTASQLVGIDISPKAQTRFQELTGGTIVPDVKTLMKRSDVVFLAVKPQNMVKVMQEAVTEREQGHNVFWITIAAGLPIKLYLKHLGQSARVLRVMPNTPCLVGEGALAYATSDSVTDADKTLAETLLGSVGKVFSIPENHLDAVTGVSGSGPAYVYMMIEAMTEGGVKMGLTHELSSRLATQTVLGAAKMVAETGEHPAVLRNRVCSPGGTTITSVHVLEEEGFRAAVMNAVEAAVTRAKELAAE